MSIIGIDLSLTSPSLCVFEGDSFSLSSCTFYYLTSVNKAVIDHPWLNGELWPSYNNDMERYNIISSWVLDKFVRHNVQQAFIEDYAYGATGRVFNIAENTGILKYNIWQKDIPCTAIPPTVIKKFATGKGNANKEKMQDAFVEETCTSIKKLLKLTDKQWNPSSDIIDSFYVCKYGVMNGQEE